MEENIGDVKINKREVPTRFQTSVIMELQEAFDAHLGVLFEDMNLLAIHCKRVTILQRYMTLARKIHNEPPI
jgi:histone H3/H4